MILATVRLTILPEGCGPISKSLKSLVREAMYKQGCLSSRLYHDENAENVFVCEQIWRDQDDLNLYLRSEEYRHLLLVMELASKPPEIKFHTISETHGMEVIEMARGMTRNCYS